MGNFISVGSRKIGDGCPCFIIAEIGMNHDGNKDKAKKLIAAAARAGADAVKFQTFKAQDIINPLLPIDYDPDEPVPKGFTYFWEYIRQFELPYSWHDELIEYSRKHKITFISTPCSIEALDFLFERVPVFKIASMDLTNIPFLNEVGKRKKPVILSTGIGTLAEIEAAIHALRSSGCAEMAIMHCVSNYPAKPQELNLRNIRMLKETFSLPVGFSDHSLGVTGAVAAVALGACIIEKHITLGRKTPGPDHYFALEPGELKDLVTSIREAELSLGSENRIITKSERLKRTTYRRSLLINKDLNKGHALIGGDISIIRPGSGIQPVDFPKVLGMKLKKSLKAYTPLKWEHLFV